MSKHIPAVPRTINTPRLYLRFAITLLGLGISHYLSAADGVLHHFSFDYLTSPKHTDTYFPIRISARDDVGNVVANFNGSGKLSATDSGVAVPITGVTSATFRNGIWEPYVSISTRRNALILHCANTDATVTGDANAIRIDPPSVQTVSIANTDLAYSPTTGLLYASTANGSLVPINPETVTGGAAVSVAATPITTLLASDDGTQLFAAHADNQRLLRIPTSTLVPAANFPLGTNGEIIRDLTTVPGQPLAVAVATTKGIVDGPFDLAIFDSDIRRAKVLSTNDRVVSLLNNGIAGRLLAVVRGQNSDQLFRASIDATGISLLDRKIISFNSFHAAASGDHLANAWGEFIDTASGNLLASIAKTGTGLVCFDPDANRIYFLESYSWWSYALRCFDATTFEEVDRLDVQDVQGTPTRLLRWGQRGLAFRTEEKVFILTGDFVPNSTSADLNLDVFDSPNPAVAGRPLTYTLRVTNNGKIPAENVVLTDQLPAGTTFENASTSQGTISRAGATITANLGTIPAGASVLIDIQIVPPAAGSLTNIARVQASTADPSTLNNQVETASYAQPDSGGLLQHGWIGAAGLATDGDHLFVTLTNTSPARPNSVATIDPATLALLRADLIGSRPGLIELTDDWTHAIVGVGGICAMRSLDLASGVAGPIISFPLASNGYHLSAREFAPLPGSNTAVAVNCWSTNGDLTGELAIYDGVTRRAGSISDPGSHIRLSSYVDENKLNALLDGFPPGFATFEVTANGPFLVKNTASLSVSTNGVGTARIKPLGKSVVTTNGVVIDTEHHSTITQLPCRGVIAPDLENHRVYFLSANIRIGDYVGPGTITAFDTDTWQTTATIPLGSIAEPVDLVRWGEYGLAFVTKNGGLSTNGALYSLTSQQLVPCPPLRVKLPAAATEGDGALLGAGRVELVRPAPTALTVTLTSSAPSTLSVPASVVIPQGATSVTFDLTVPNNNYLNGPRTVTISPAATGQFTFRPATITVRDDEVATLSLSLPTAVTEGGPSVSGAARVTLSGITGVDIPVSLSSSDTTELVVPPAVIIPAGANSATFDLSTPDDDVLDGAQTAEVTASVPGWAGDSRSVTVHDNDPKTLTLTLPARLTESTSTYGAVVSLSAKTLVPVEVSLVSSSPLWLYLSNTVTIPAGSQSATFTLLAGNDSEANYSRTVAVTATAVGSTAGIQNIVIVDDDPASVVWSNITSPKQAGSTITATLSLKTLEGEPATGFFGTVEISATNEKGAAVVLPTTIYSISGASGVASVTVNTAGTQTKLVANTNNGAIGTSNDFIVAPSAATTLHWDPISSVQLPNIAFPVTLRAMDSFGNTIPDFSGNTTLSVFQEAQTHSINEGTQATQFPIRCHGYYGAMVGRATFIIPATTLTSPRTLRSIALEVVIPPEHPFENFTIRLKHTSRSAYIYQSTDQWEANGWTVVYRKATALAAPGWITLPFDTTFAYDGTSNLLLDISYDNSASGNICSCWLTGTYNTYGNQTLAMDTYTSDFGDPLLWTGSTPDPDIEGDYPSLRLGSGIPADCLSPTTISITDGTWSGPIIVTIPGQTMLTAKCGALFGESNTFTIFAQGDTPPSPIIIRVPSWTAGTSNKISWTQITSANAYEVQCATDAGFTNPTSSGSIPKRSYVFTNLTDTITYYYRVRSSGYSGSTPVLGPWSAVASSTQDAAAPELHITSPAISTTAAFTLVGTASDFSGLSYVTIDGALATSTDGYTHWLSATTLQPGQNAFAVAAYDNASPFHITQKTTTVFYVSPSGDSDGDGLSDLLEYALGLDLLVADSTGTPTAALQINSADGLSYLTFTYRRRLVRTGLTYHIETSTDLTTWSEVAAPEEIATVANADGLTETVTVRIQPAIDASPRRFVRLKVTTP